MSTLVTGGAGYIGSHVVRLLQGKGEKVVVVDDLSSGDASRIGDSRLVELDIASDGAREQLAKVMREEGIDSVIHFAAKKQVGESVQKPAMYYRQNIGGMANLLGAMQDAEVPNIVFSSSAAVYGMPDMQIITEDVEKNPINPYGRTKLIGEQMLADSHTACGMNYIALRYFNAAGAGWDDLADTATMNLVPIVEEALAQGKAPVVFGDDYATADGSCVRDYIHVMDLAKAHLNALDALRDPNSADGVSRNRAFNVGTGQGNSVFQVLDGMRKATGYNFEHKVGERRAGDPAALIADASAIEQQLGWVSELDLDDILESSWRARQAGPRPVELPA